MIYFLMFVMLMKRKKRFINFIMLKQYRRRSGVFTCNLAGVLQNFNGSWGEIGKISDGSSHNI